MNKPEGPKLNRKAQGKRPTIAFLVDAIEHIGGYQHNAWEGAMDAAQEQDVNLLCFVGRSLHSPYGPDAQITAIYDLVTAGRVDGLVLTTASICARIDQEETRQFLARFRPLPIVNIGLALSGYPSLLVDNERGLRDVLIHLIEDHGLRRIAFIRGPATNEEAERRYRTYVKVLTEHGLTPDPNLIAPGDFVQVSGAMATKLLLDERKASFEAIVAANDLMALGAIEALQERGIRVPHDVRVTGFDDEELTRFVTPPLTTVRQPTYEMGRLAVETVLALLAGDKAPEQVTLPTEIVIRQSCGCLSPAVLEVKAAAPAKTGRMSQSAPTPQRERILSEIALASLGTNADQAGRLVDAFLADLKDGTDTFLQTLDIALSQILLEGGDPNTWQNVISILRRHTLPYLTGDILLRAENLWQQARVMISEAAQRDQAHKRLLAAAQDQTLRYIGQALSTTAEVGGLANVLARELPGLGIPGCYIALYEGKPRPSPWSRLILAYDERGRLEAAEGRRFPTTQIIPADLLGDNRYTCVVNPLYTRNDQLGFVLLKAGPRTGPLYEALRDQLSSGFEAALTIQQTKKRALQLQTAAEVARAASGILDPNILIQQVVELTRERFDLYYVGLFLVDQTGEWTGEPGKWAVLRAGTGEAGRKMIAQGHKLEIGGTSMIGCCIANKQARIALDVGEEAVRFDNPLLPDTHSEMALPLISRGQALGALTIQSTQPAAFSEEDIAILQTMASQLANAIENARLFEQTQAALREMEAAHQRYLQQEWSEYLRSQIITSYEIGQADTLNAEAVQSEIRQALERQRPVLITKDQGEDKAPHSTLVIPIALRGAVIGALGIHNEGQRPWDEDDVELAQAIAERMALAAENLRLLDQTQRRAAREQLIGEITSRMRETLDMETVVKRALDEIYRALSLDKIAIRLTMD